MSVLRSIALAAAAVLVAGCVIRQDGPTYSPSTGELAKPGETKLTATIRPGDRPALESDEAGLRMMYDNAEADFRTSAIVVRNPELNRYIKDLVCKLAGPYCNDIRAYVIRAPYFNATMGPNGAMQVWTGLLLRVRNEAQLVAVLGHELGHYLRQHSLQRMRDHVNTTNALAFFQLASAGVGVGIVGNLGTVVAMAHLSAFSRDQEREADLFGHQFMVEHGYDPFEASRIWQQLREEQEAASNEDESLSVFLSTHPLPEERQATLAELAEEAKLGATLTKTNAETFDAVVLPHRELLLQDELNLRRFDRFEALLDMLIEDGKRLSELYFFRGEIYRLRGEGLDAERAFDDYKAAMTAGKPPVNIYRSLGQLHEKREEKEQARKAYTRYLELQPDAEDADIIRYLIGQLSYPS